MTDGVGSNEDVACEELKLFSIKNNNLLTFAVGFGQEYNFSTLQKIVENGNTRTKWFTLNMLEHKPAKDCIIKIGN
jgi:hypothetical protein